MKQFKNILFFDDRDKTLEKINVQMIKEVFQEVTESFNGNEVSVLADGAKLLICDQSSEFAGARRPRIRELEILTDKEVRVETVDWWENFDAQIMEYLKGGALVFCDCSYKYWYNKNSPTALEIAKKLNKLSTTYLALSTEIVFILYTAEAIDEAGGELNDILRRSAEIPSIRMVNELCILNKFASDESKLRLSGFLEDNTDLIF
jgi:hypothetical protein